MDVVTTILWTLFDILNLQSQRIAAWPFLAWYGTRSKRAAITAPGDWCVGQVRWENFLPEAQPARSSGEGPANRTSRIGSSRNRKVRESRFNSMLWGAGSMKFFWKQHPASSILLAASMLQICWGWTFEGHAKSTERLDMEKVAPIDHWACSKQTFLRPGLRKRFMCRSVILDTS